MKAPSPRNLKSFVAWMQNEAPLTQEESDFLEHQDDFVAVSSEQEAGWLDGVVEDTLKWCMPKKIREVQFSPTKVQYLSRLANINQAALYFQRAGAQK